MSGLILALGGHNARLTRSLMELNKAFGWLTSRRRAGVLYRLTVARPRQSARQYRKVEVLSLNRGVMNLDISADRLLATRKSSDFKRVKADFTEERFAPN